MRATYRSMIFFCKDDRPYYYTSHLSLSDSLKIRNTSYEKKKKIDVIFS